MTDKAREFKHDKHAFSDFDIYTSRLVITKNYGLLVLDISFCRRKRDMTTKSKVFSLPPSI